MLSSALQVNSSLRSSEVIKKEKELNEVRRRYFTARTPRTKEKYRKRDAKLRGQKLVNYSIA